MDRRALVYPARGLSRFNVIWLPYRARYYATSSKDDSVCWINFIRALAGLKVVLEGVSTD